MYPPGGAETPDLTPQRQAPELELRLLRAAVQTIVAQHPGCSTCGRSLLVGESYEVFEAGTGEHHVCALCAAAAPKAPQGELLRTERVRVGKRRLAVKPAA
jgi:hypothetical protein